MSTPAARRPNKFAGNAPSAHDAHYRRGTRPSPAVAARRPERCRPARWELSQPLKEKAGNRPKQTWQEGEAFACFIGLPKKKIHPAAGDGGANRHRTSLIPPRTATVDEKFRSSHEFFHRMQIGRERKISFASPRDRAGAGDIAKETGRSSV